MVDLKILANLVIEGDKTKVTELVGQAIAEGVPLGKVLNDGLIAGMNIVGERMKKREIYIPEVLKSGACMQAGMDALKSQLTTGAIILGPKVVLGTVKGDIHNIGKNLVRMMLASAGFQVIDLGINLPPEKFVQTAKEEGVQIVGMSALLTTTMHEMKTVIDALGAAGLREKIKIIVGGAPVTPEFAKQIGADGYAPDAAHAVDKVRELIG